MENVARIFLLGVTVFTLLMSITLAEESVDGNDEFTPRIALNCNATLRGSRYSSRPWRAPMKFACVPREGLASYQRRLEKAQGAS
jgi:hypothetical protein